MDNRKVVKNWHTRILEECQERLGRKLTSYEERFVTSRGGFIALEVIEDTVNSMRGAELEAYLNSENE
ncbi:MAG: hypothetical protein AAFV47_01040 [Pseudomonadota bacterium]